MSHEQYGSQNPNSFAAEYVMPEDQFGAELQLRDQYAQQYPEMAPILHVALADLQREAGIKQQKYSPLNYDGSPAEYISDEQQDIMDSMAGPVHPDFFRSVFLANQIDISKEEYDALPQVEQTKVAMAADGHVVINMPAATKALVEGLYALTGASVIRDQRNEGLGSGEVLRSGEYMGTTIYFAENYSDNTPMLQGDSTFSLRIIGASLAERQRTALNMKQFNEFAVASGVSRFELRQFIAENKVTVDNYKEVAAVLQATRQAIDGGTTD